MPKKIKEGQAVLKTYFLAILPVRVRSFSAKANLFSPHENVLDNVLYNLLDYNIKKKMVVTHIFNFILSCDLSC